jgi:hypothetical protein
LILVVRLAFEIGAGSGSAFGFVSSGIDGVMTGMIVERDSGNRRVRNSVDDCLYILEICEEACRVEEELREEIEEESSWDDESVSRVGLRVVAMEPLKVMTKRIVPSLEGSGGKKGEGS